MGPASIRQPSVSNVPVNAMDLFPTLSEIVGTPLASDRRYDGESWVPLFSGGSLKRKVDQPFYYYNCENLQALRLGDWKLHLTQNMEKLPFWDKNKAFTQISDPILYNLRSDPRETVDVAADHPEIVQQILDVAEKTRMQLGEYMVRGDSQRPTGSVFDDVEIISHEKDWMSVNESIRQTIYQERLKRYPNLSPKKRSKK